MTARNQSNVALGIAGQKCIRLARAEEGLSAARYRATVCDAQVESSRAATVICLADHATLYRVVSLPQVDATAMEKLALRQVEAMLPLPADRFATGWVLQPGLDNQAHVILCAVRRELLAESIRTWHGHERSAIVPSLLAAASAWLRFGNGADTNSAIVILAERSSALAVVAGGQVLQCAVVSLGARHLCLEQSDPQDQANLLAQWQSELREVYSHCLDGLPALLRPQQCRLMGAAAARPEVRQGVQAALRLPTAPAEAAEALSVEGGSFAADAEAIGAALSCIEDGLPVVRLERSGKGIADGLPGQEPGTRGVVRRRWATMALAAWLLAVVACLWWMDQRQAESVHETVNSARQQALRQGLGRQLAIGQFLESQRPSALEALDAIAGVLPKEAILTGYRYGRDGEVTIAGLASNENDFFELMKKLAQFGEVDYRPAKSANGGFQFEVRLRLASRLPAAGTAETQTTVAGGTADIIADHPEDRESVEQVSAGLPVIVEPPVGANQLHPAAPAHPQPAADPPPPGMLSPSVPLELQTPTVAPQEIQESDR